MSTPARSLVRRSPAHRADVLANVELTPRMRRVTVRAAALVDVPIRPAQDVELLLREESGRRVKRRYTISHARPGTGELDLDVLLHGSGPGSRWGATAARGDELEFQGPRGKLELRSAPWHLLAGDESALPAIAAISAALPPSERSIAVIEVCDESDELPLGSDTRRDADPRWAPDIRWLHRGETPPGGADLLVHALEQLDLPKGAGQAYLLGETRAMVALRGVLEGRGVGHDAIFVKGYWNLGRPDRLANRPPS